MLSLVDTKKLGIFGFGKTFKCKCSNNTHKLQNFYVTWVTKEIEMLHCERYTSFTLMYPVKANIYY